jgi:trk system potassium uptake protein TrkH
MGIIVLALAILPILGIGGMQLYKAEVPGPTKDKLTPRIQQTAKLLWGVYVLMSVAETALLLLAKMDLFDAICHTFGTVATGGFSTRNASIAAFENPWVHWIIIIFMVLAATNFTLHYYALKGRPLHYLRDVQFRYFISSLIIGITLVSLTSFSSIIEHGHSLRDVIFDVVSQGTCTGFATVDYELWHPAAITVIILLMFMGGMVGATSGGLKTMRWVLVFKQIIIEIRKLIHPNAVYAVRLGEQVIPEKVAANILSFSLLFITTYIVSALALLLLGLDYATALGGPIACLSNVGPGLGLVGPVENYALLAASAKWVFIADMIAGRLEIFTILVLFSRSFWRK